MAWRMSWHRDPWLICDGCQAVQYPENAGELGLVDATIRELRAAAKEDGWVFNGQDFCPKCATDRIEPVREEIGREAAEVLGSDW